MDPISKYPLNLADKAHLLDNMHNSHVHHELHRTPWVHSLQHPKCMIIPFTAKGVNKLGFSLLWVGTTRQLDLKKLLLKSRRVTFKDYIFLDSIEVNHRWSVKSMELKWEFFITSVFWHCFFALTDILTHFIIRILPQF